MAELFREVTKEERVLYYKAEWNAKKLPRFLVEKLENREFGFDHTGEGPSDRKNVFMDVRDLEDYIKATAPYAIYSSVALYEDPKGMSGWLGAELVFDIDAKDLPLRRCGHIHEHGKVCPICLGDAKELARDTLVILKEDFGFEDVHVVYSGRGYHIRVLDDWAIQLDSKSREKILAYISAAEEVTFEDIQSRKIMLSSGYFRVFRLRFGYFIARANENHLLNIGLRKGQVKKILESRDEIYEGFVRKGLLTAFPQGIGYKTLARLFALSSTFSKAYFDGRVTVDVKRILRVPSSLHSKVGLVATYIGSDERKLEKFNPFRDAVPKFREEEVKEAYEEWLELHGDEL
ncbi:eukaryotic-type DNA primase, small subunit [Thermococcus onnurineus NA1]|uniref:DNA primase small subunit PriS n=1 Tax=Thermococcus onnurineus (strain NA1) TaxID=523850 RepID=PRIS_THEON|nr:DNA primase catalytic subunit PriS [Thermococcus onnurineus]B6YV39.1 RecName: Full=DNA primase small subunit PriS [Thermococcus onnurineus NA1]ACJ17267.1 eukaryotic-type DNA primase, small subunit [Thermococcus onnurineus NA1]